MVRIGKLTAYSWQILAEGKLISLNLIMSCVHQMSAIKWWGPSYDNNYSIALGFIILLILIEFYIKGMQLFPFFYSIYNLWLVVFLKSLALGSWLWEIWGQFCLQLIWGREDEWNKNNNHSPQKIISPEVALLYSDCMPSQRQLGLTSN